MHGTKTHIHRGRGTGREWTTTTICSIICEADIVPYDVVNVRVNSAYLMWKDTRCLQYNSQYSRVLFHAHQNEIRWKTDVVPSSTVED